MINPIVLIKKLYQLDKHNPEILGFDIDEISDLEQLSQLTLPPLLFHYCRELGKVQPLNHSHHVLLPLPFAKTAEHLVIAKDSHGEAIWGIHQDDPNQTNPLVFVSRNHDTYDLADIHWIKELPLASFLLAQAIFNGVNGGLNHYAQVFDFIGDTIPSDIGEKLKNIGALEINELQQEHERFFQIDDYKTVFMLSFNEMNLPNAFYMGGQDTTAFSRVANQLAVAWDTLV
ncbi:hypothetical protein [Faucicola boevrei]|uniref:hypothetical protein n=1 Tax=Faucicola boevrei TaxID=346665 RepID=UPI00037E466C|nr:hypothetical protein [Moraxella boevrei]